MRADAYPHPGAQAAFNRLLEPFTAKCRCRSNIASLCPYVIRTSDRHPSHLNVVMLDALLTLAINDILMATVQPVRLGKSPDRRSGTRCAETLDRCGAKRMSVETALAQLLRMIHHRALNLAALRDDERDPYYDSIRRSCCGAAEHIGQSPDNAAITANSMVEFTRAMVGIIEAGRG
ncbi:hypothetical protein [Mesorhizobium sp. B2-7-2]|uniref:hypothetical protein n=1 Tax=Mesorhizobium sp. B2-7-2 TaxID=2589908 RepID=UPI00112A882D|nr:hypothetical protein [Mesorhizobium sp. B2-7-2]TPJ28017.1 hypothetical protein FJ425_13315 [Mesorhizobium sp. B2-7-2]